MLEPVDEYVKVLAEDFGHSKNEQKKAASNERVNNFTHSFCFAYRLGCHASEILKLVFGAVIFNHVLSPNSRGKSEV